MAVSLGILALALASLAAGLAIIAHRRSPGSSATQWSARASLLLSLGIIVGATPTLVFPASQWLTLTGSLLSLILTGASLLLLRHVRRAGRGSAPDRQLFNER